MSKATFDSYLRWYIDEYYTLFSGSLLEYTGNLFSRKSDAELEQWVRMSGTFHRYSKEERVPFVDFSGMFTSTFQKDDRKDDIQLPAYAAALQAFLHYDGDVEVRQSDKTLHRDMAAIAHVGRSTFSCWCAGTKLPSKYHWWALGIGKLMVDYQDIAPFLDMIGCTLDMTCLDDVILYYSLCRRKSRQEIYRLLKVFDCRETMRIFEPIAENDEDNM